MQDENCDSRVVILTRRCIEALELALDSAFPFHIPHIPLTPIPCRARVDGDVDGAARDAGGPHAALDLHRAGGRPAVGRRRCSDSANRVIWSTNSTRRASGVSNDRRGAANSRRPCRRRRSPAPAPRRGSVRRRRSRIAREMPRPPAAAATRRAGGEFDHRLDDETRLVEHFEPPRVVGFRARAARDAQLRRSAFSTDTALGVHCTSACRCTGSRGFPACSHAASCSASAASHGCDRSTVKAPLDRARCAGGCAWRGSAGRSSSHLQACRCGQIAARAAAAAPARRSYSFHDQPHACMAAAIAGAAPS